MQIEKIEHRTITIKKQVSAPPVRVFKALASTKEKKIWSVPKGDEIRFSKSNFKIGGVEKFKCGSIGNLNYSGVIYYCDIVKNQRIVYLETVFYEESKLASALISTELLEKGRGTLVVMTIQVASYCGKRMLQGYETGHLSSLENLAEYLI